MGKEPYRDLQYAKFSAYGFLKNLRFFEPFLILFFLEKGLSYLQVGALYAIREISINILEIPTGVLADGLGRRRTMVFSFLAYIASFALFFLGVGMRLFVPAMLLFALGDAFRTGTHKAMIMDYLRGRGWSDMKSDYYGHTRAWSQVGAAVSAVIAAGIVFYSGTYARVFLFSAIPYVLDLLLMLTYPKALDGPIGEMSARDVLGAFRRVLRSMVAAFRKPKLLQTITNASLYGGFYKGTKDYLQPLVSALALSAPILLGLGQEQRSAVFVGVIYSLLYLLTSLASRNAAKLASRFEDPARAMDVELALGLAAGVAIGALHFVGFSLGAVVLFFGVYGLQNFRRPLSVAVVSDSVDNDIQATALSVESQLQSLFAAAIAFLIGLVADLAGGRIGLGLLAVSAVLLSLMPFFAVSFRRQPRVEGAEGTEE
jgi:hypothetical protein